MCIIFSTAELLISVQRIGRRSSTPSFDVAERLNQSLRVRSPWMVLEVLSFGTISKLFENLKPGLQGKKAIIQHLGFKTGGGSYLGSWLKSLVTVRNLCAHHARVMNRTFVHTPRYARTIRNQAWHGRWPDARRVYTMLTIIGVIVETIPGVRNGRSRR